MRSSLFRCLSGAFLVALAAPRMAAAQACCAGASTLSPTRLSESESMAVGVQLRASVVSGSFDGAGRWRASPAGFTERDLSQEVFGVVRFRDRLQLGLVVPVVETFRRVPGLSDAGGGVGDVKASARLELLAPGVSQTWPGVALLAGASLPTGRPVESATHPLASDATGLGSLTGLLGVALERPQDHLLLQLVATIQLQTSRSASGLRESFGAQSALSFAAGWAFDSGPGIALVGALRHDGAARIDGVALAGSGRTVTTLGLAGGAYVAQAWRVQGLVSAPLPVDGAARSTLGSPGVQLALLRSWL